MVTLVNRAKVTTATTGTGTITLGSAESGYQSFADAGVSNSDVVRYVLEDGDAWEIGSGTYTSTGTTLSRTLDESSTGSLLNLSGSAVVFITAAAEDVFQGELFAENYDGTSTLPSATGANAVAIGTGVGGPANASGFNAIALGVDAQSTGGASVAMAYSTASASYSFAAGGGNSQTYGASGANSAAIGTSSNARGSGSVALGKSAYVDTLGTQAVALGDSYASGSHSLAAAISTNSSSYGATGANSVAIGSQAKATGTYNVAIGREALADGAANAFAFGRRADAGGAGSLALGLDSDASGVNSIAIGQSYASGTDSLSAGIGSESPLYGAQHDNAVALGYQAITTAAKQIALGSSTAQVKVSGAYTLPTSDGTNGQVLTTDGSGAVTFADAGGGGADLYAANESSPTAQPSATGDNAVAIGDQAIASGPDSFAIGEHSDATGTRTHAFGFGAVATHTNALALGTSRAFSADAAAIAIDNNSTSYGASGANSVAIGYLAKATNADAIAFGDTSTASGGNSFAHGRSSIANSSDAVAIGIGATSTASRSFSFGDNCIASASYSFSIGRSTKSSYNYSYAFGYNTEATRKGVMVYGGGQFASRGDAQSGTMVLRRATTDATATVLTSDGSTPAGVNEVQLPNNSAYSFSGTIIARESAAAGSDYASWEIKGALLRDANAASTVLGNGIKNKLYASAGASAWDIALTADTTNGGLAITVTGAAATNIRWVATVNTSEVTYA